MAGDVWWDGQIKLSVHCRGGSSVRGTRCLAADLWQIGERPSLMVLSYQMSDVNCVGSEGDYDIVLCLRNGNW